MPTIKKLYFSSGTSVTAPADISTSGGSGSGEINLVANPNDADAGWAASGAGVTVATTTTTTDLPLGGIISSAIKITPVSGTSDYARYRFTIAESLKNRKLKIQWEQRPLSGYASGDLKLEMHTNTASDYSGTDATLALSTDSSSVTSINNFTGRFVTYFDSNSSNYYEIRIKRVAGTTALNITSVIVGPGIQPQGAVISEWESWTPTFYNLGTVTNINFKRRRVGSMMESIGYFTTGSVSAAIGSIGMPTGLTVDTSKIAGNRSTQLGHITRLSTATVDPLGKVYLTYSSTGGTDRLLIAESTTGGSYEQKNVDNILAGTENEDVYMLVPIAEWSNNGTINIAQNDVEYAYNTDTSDADNTTAFGYGPGGTVFGSYTAARTKTVRFQTPHQETDTYQIEIFDTTAWIPLGTYSNSVVPLTNQGTETYGMTLDNSSTSSTDLIVQFGKYRLMGSGTFGAAGLAWSGLSASIKWRVRKVKGGVAVGFGKATTTESGLAPAGVFSLENSVVNLQELSATPANTASGTECKVYMKGDKFIIAFNDAGTMRYKYLDLTSTGVTWVHTTTAP